MIYLVEWFFNELIDYQQTPTSIDLAELKTGIYLISIEKEGSPILVERIAKQ